MKHTLMLFIMLIMVSSLIADKGEDIFKMTCSACHRVGGGKLVGPDLKDVTKRREKDWLIRWVKSSQSLVKQGDETAVALFEENNKVIMPDNPLTDEEVLAVMDYITQQSALAPAQASTLSEVKSPSSRNRFSSALRWLLAVTIILFFVIILVQSHVIRTLIKELRKIQNQI